MAAGFDRWKKASSQLVHASIEPQKFKVPLPLLNSQSPPLKLILSASYPLRAKVSPNTSKNGPTGPCSNRTSGLGLLGTCAGELERWRFGKGMSFAPQACNASVFDMIHTRGFRAGNAPLTGSLKKVSAV